ncbi:MAG: PEP-CTERM sorting domain-containing protein [Bryobacterales bacterium]|nr:PEP-CTERM sorting domain-containing protein [Bryobacterales bacterium]
MRTYLVTSILAVALPLSATQITTFVSTGTDVTGNRDNAYQVVTTPSGPITYDTVPYDAYVTPNPVPPAFPVGVIGGWFSNDSNSQWITAQGDLSNGDNLGEFQYQTQFDLTGFDPISVSLQFRIWADNTVSSVFLNGVATGAAISDPINFVDPTGMPVSLDGSSYAFNSGINTLSFALSNTSFLYPMNVSGFRLQVDKAEGNLSPVPEPSTLALLTVGLVVTGWAARRRKRA